MRAARTNSQPGPEGPTLVSYLIVLFLAGPTLGLVGLALPHAADANNTGILALVASAYLTAGVLFVLRRRFPPWGVDVCAALSSVLISASIYFSGSTVNTGAYYYLWIAIGVAYFLPPGRVAIQLVIVAVGYAVALALKPPMAGEVQSWIITVGTLSVAAALFSVTRARVESLVARLNDAADTDHLTGLLNRRGFAKRLDLELERAERAGMQLSLIAGDLDRFKEINDRFGHQAGDDVLVAVAEVLRRHARRIDCVARVGGEEFALIASGSDATGAYASAERLRSRLHAELADCMPGLTISFGIATYPADASSGDNLLRCADESLYAAKALGRDCTVAHDRELDGQLAERLSGPASPRVAVE